MTKHPKRTWHVTVYRVRYYDTKFWRYIAKTPGLHGSTLTRDAGGFCTRWGAKHAAKVRLKKEFPSKSAKQHRHEYTMETGSC